MPRNKSNTRSRPKQAKKSEIDALRAERRSAQSELRKAIDRAEAADARLMKAREAGIREAIRHNRKKDKEALQRERLAHAIRTGLYAPKSKKLTKHRKRTINKLYKENRFLFDPSIYNFAPITKYDKKTRKDIKRHAAEHGIKATDKGLFVKSANKSQTAKVTKIKGGYTVKRSFTSRPVHGSKRVYAEEIVMIDKSSLEQYRERMERHFRNFWKRNKQIGYVSVYIAGNRIPVDYHKEDSNAESETLAVIMQDALNYKPANQITPGYISILSLRYHHDELDDGEDDYIPHRKKRRQPKRKTNAKRKSRRT